MNKYTYITSTPTWLVRTVYALGALSWAMTVWGFSGIIAVDPVYRYVVAPLLAFITFYHVVSFGVLMFYKRFDLAKHHKQVADWQANTPRSVDVFLPICNEPEAVLKRTWAAVAAMDYPNYQVYVLDDSTHDHADLAAHYGFTYLRRPNRGEMKKAGNLKYGYERSSGDFIVIFDADFAPHKDFIQQTLPMMSDPNVAIVQTPQAFEIRGQLEHGGAYVQEDFYRMIQVARDRLGAALCCGSNALYRRSALDTIGGTAQVEHSEDAITGFKLTAKGYKVRYLPIILATGYCPDDVHQYIHQQHRWCSGSMSLMKTKEFWTSRLTFGQKISYISGFLYYLSHPAALLFSFQIFITLFFYSEHVSLANAIPFYPYLAWSFITLPLVRILPLRFGSYYAQAVQLFTYTRAVMDALFGRHVGWTPTNTKSSKVSATFRKVYGSVKTYVAVYVVLVLLALLAGDLTFDLHSASLDAWIVYNVALTGVLFLSLRHYSRRREQV